MYNLYRAAMEVAAAGAGCFHRTGLGWPGQEERFGKLPPDVEQRLGGRSVVWVHAASVGEMRALGPLLGLLCKRLPRSALVVSATSRAGRKMAGDLPDVDLALMLPFDAPTIVERVLDRVRPRLVIVTETEIWPAFLGALGSREIPVVLLSARVSRPAFRRYCRVRGALRPVLPAIRFFGTQSAVDSERLVALGANPERVAVTGSLKEDAGAVVATLRFECPGPVWVAGSTHPGEERLCVEVFQRVRRDFPDLSLVLAPRHLDRLDEVERLLGEHFVLRSALGEVWNGSPAVLLVDTLGELAGFYGAAAVAFVGGTLEPIGGHNLREPAQVGVPVLFGPHFDSVNARLGRSRPVGVVGGLVTQTGSRRP